MEDLRGVLAVIGIGIIVFVYWYTRREQDRSHEDPVGRLEPRFSAEIASATDSPVDEAISEDAIQATLASEAELSAEIPEKIVAIRLVARGGEAIGGEELVLALRGLGLRHGQFGIFHRHEGEDDAVLFSVANLLEPGNFDLANIRGQELPGVSMFMVLPGPLSGPLAFDAMIETARALAKSVNGEVLDAAGSSLSIQRERFIREEIIQYEHGLSFG